MKRIALGETLAAAYGFLVSRIGSIIGVAWLPILVGAATTTTIAFLHQSHILPFGVGLLGFVIPLLVGSMVMVGMMQLALGQRARAGVYFSLAAPVWRLIGLRLLASLVLIVFAIVAVIVLTLVWIVMGLPAIQPPADPSAWTMFPANQFILCHLAGASCLPLGVRIGIVGLIAVGVCALCYIALRMMYFIPAVVVAEKSMSLERTWVLTGRNFWRILVIYLLTALPFAVVAWIATHVATVAFVGHGIALKDLDILPVAKAVEGAPAFLIVTLAIKAVAQVLTAGVTAGAISHAYRAVTAE